MHIEALYRQASDSDIDLDDALSQLDFDQVRAVLESFFVALRNVPKPSNSAIVRWNAAFHFIRETCERIDRNPAVAHPMVEIRARIQRLDNLYLGLRPFRKRLGSQLRAIPKTVLLELLDAATPGSSTNPFPRLTTQWRVYSMVTLMIFQGLRRGELLSLPANFLRSEVDIRTGNRRWYMSVKTNEIEDDPRASPPSIKTTQSIRSIPVTRQTAEGLMAYAESYRGRPNHKYFLNSVRDLPLSLEGVTKSMQKLTSALSESAKEQLMEITGATWITAHALRHTCAVVRMKQWLNSGQSPEQAMSHSRSFFGWSKTSVMPMHYAKAALDERLNETWDDQLDERLQMLRALPV